MYFRTSMKIVMVAFALLLAVTFRITLPWILRLDGIIYLQNYTATAIEFYLAITSLIGIIIILFLVSFLLLDLTSDWIALWYIPLSMWAMYWTYCTFLGDLRKLRLKADMEDLAEKWVKYINTNDTYWTELELKLHCCGFDGPRWYMHYLRRIPQSCYKPHLITEGCQSVLHGTFDSIHTIAFMLYITAIFLEYFILVFYVGFLFKERFSTVLQKKQMKFLGKLKI
ncbi:uncharacterized protein [Drosophila pseudoobscura]|uniref:Tetraspanin n=1 Tax=Drosophila pseudoobscura pseudoobscura TaxID=46245 RepID=A0A6I8V5C7_DROPS|nr:uncharacterized protein LOC4818101 [Drosophila pseudoobscura]XP_033235868.1 uncharacterized protein LOC4818101 [Drosophila pseudoobscura]